MHRITKLSLILVCTIFSSCPEKKPATKDAGKEKHSHFEKAQQLIKQGKETEAARELRQAILKDPKAAEPRVVLCRLLAPGNEVQRALDACEAALRLVPKDAESRYTTARLQLRKRDFRAALKVLEPALKLPIKDKVQKGRVYALAGVLQLQLGKTKDAVASLQQASRIDPKSRAAFRNLAISLAQSGRCDEARAAGKKAEALGDKGHAIAGALNHYCELMMRLELEGRALLIDKRVVSGGEYSSCVDVRACPKVAADAEHRKDRKKPSRSIHWSAAKAYCAKLNKRLPTLAEYKAAYKQLQWERTLGEWTGDVGKKPDTAVQVRKAGTRLKALEAKKDSDKSSTVRCAKDIS